MKNTLQEKPVAVSSAPAFPDINISDIAEVLERKSITRPDAKLEKILKQIDQDAVKKAAKKAGDDFSAQILAAYDEVARQLDKKDLI